MSCQLGAGLPASTAAPAAARDGDGLLQRLYAAAHSAGDAGGGEGINPGTAASVGLRAAAPGARNMGLTC